MAQMVKKKKKTACNAEDQGLIPGSGRSLEKGMVTHSSTFDWRIPWTEDSNGLQSTGWQSWTRLSD